MATQPQNWQRGALRLWVVASLVWMVGMGWYQYQAVSKEPSSSFTIQFSEESGIKLESNSELLDADPADCESYFGESNIPRKFSALMFKDRDDCIEKLAAIHQEYNIAQIKRALPVFVPPLLVLLMFPIIGWVRRGFKTN